VAIRGIYADDTNNTVIVLWDGSGLTTIGTHYSNTYAWFMTLRDGTIVDGTAFYDSISFNELWEKVTPGTK
jgi:ketosteroid isomerase-like protein